MNIEFIEQPFEETHPQGLHVCAACRQNIIANCMRICHEPLPLTDLDQEIIQELKHFGNSGVHRNVTCEYKCERIVNTTPWAHECVWCSSEKRCSEVRCGGSANRAREWYNDSSIDAAAKQYCARHGYHYALARHTYPLCGQPDRDCPQDVCKTQYPALRLISAIRPQYDWILYKQFDAMFVNFTIKLEDIVEQVPADTHVVLLAFQPAVLIDIVVLVRNSEQGRRLLQKIINAQADTQGCGAPGMTGVMEFLLRQLNGTYHQGDMKVLYERTTHVENPASE